MIAWAVVDANPHLHLRLSPEARTVGWRDSFARHKVAAFVVAVLAEDFYARGPGSIIAAFGLTAIVGAARAIVVRSTRGIVVGSPGIRAARFTLVAGANQLELHVMRSRHLVLRIINVPRASGGLSHVSLGARP